MKVKKKVKKPAEETPEQATVRRLRAAVALLVEHQVITPTKAHDFGVRVSKIEDRLTKGGGK